MAHCSIQAKCPRIWSTPACVSSCSSCHLPPVPSTPAMLAFLFFGHCQASSCLKASALAMPSAWNPIPQLTAGLACSVSSFRPQFNFTSSKGLSLGPPVHGTLLAFPLQVMFQQHRVLLSSLSELAYLPDGSLSLDHRNRRLTWVSYSSLYSSTQGTVWYATDICWTIKQINNLIFPRWWWGVLNWHEFFFHFQEETTMKSTSVSDFKSQI